MSGLLMRHIDAGQDGFRGASSKHDVGLMKAKRDIGVSRVPDRSIIPSSRSCKFTGSAPILVLPSRSSGRLINCYAVAALAASPSSRLYGSPVTIIFQAIRAILLARATATSFGGLRLRSSVSQCDAARPRPALNC